MKRFLIAATALAVALAAAGCSGSTVFGKKINGSGVLRTRAVGVEPFNAVEASRGVRVVIAGQGDSLTVRADENVMEYVETHVRGGVLRIGIDKRINSLHNVQVEVTVPDNGDIRLLKASSAASIVCDQPLAQQDRVQLSATSAATVRAAVRARECRIGATSSATVCTRLEAETCEVRVSSAARVRMKGSCEQCSLRASSAGRIDAAEFTARTCSANASSAASVTVRCEESLDAHASSAGTISYAGDAVAEVSASSGGSVNKL